MRDLARRIGVALALVLLAEGAPAAQRTEAERPRLLVESQYAKVVGVPKARATARTVATLIDDAVPRIGAIVGTDDLRPVPAAIYLDRSAFVEATGIPARARVVGLATFPAGLIHVDGTGLLATIETVVPHEVGHVLTARALGPALPALPVWMNEGIAEYVAGERAAQVDPVWVRALGRGAALELTELDTAIGERGETAGLAYAEAASIVNFLVAQRGEGVIADLLSSLTQTQDFDATLREVTGWGSTELESTWRDSVVRKWRWPLLAQSPLLIYALMVLLFLVGLARYLRERRRRQETHGEDWYNSTDRWGGDV
jgi:hypothetical protein